MFSLEISNLCKNFGKFKAVDQLCLKVTEGSVYGFLGPNGAGKTTTIKMITGLSEPSGGSIKICGKEVAFGSSSGRENIGYLPDVPNFYSWMKPVEFLTFCGDLYRIDKKVLKTRIEELLDLVGLSDANRKVGGFSRGMKQRLGIAQALINEPALILMDEPASALDPIGRKDVMDIISKLAGKTTVFFSTHILADVERVCDRIAIIHKGKLIIEDTIESLRRDYSIKELEIELIKVEDAARFADKLKIQPWVGEIKSIDGNIVRVAVKDLLQAGTGIPAILAGMNAGLIGLKSLEPTLEDIFMEVVSQ